MQNKYDVIIIGGGVVGSAIARELAKYKLNTALLEKNVDVGLETSSRNSGVIHSGINYKPDTLRAKLAVRGNKLMTSLCNDLKVKYDYCGKLTVAQNIEEEIILENLMKQGRANGVPSLKILNSREMQRIQPGVKGASALQSPSTGIINPYGFNIALAENAQANGVDVLLEHEVASINYSNGFIVKCTNSTEFKSTILINAAGLYADKVSEMLGINDYKIYPCRGEYYILDKKLKGSLKTLIYPVPKSGSSGLGVHLTNTVDGNILIGPSNEYIKEKNDSSSTSEVMKLLIKEGRELLPDLTAGDFIRSFAGIRPKLTPPETGGYKDFIIEKRDNIPGFINLVGIESPGLTAAPAIAEMIRDLVATEVELIKNPEFNGIRPVFKGYFNSLSAEEKAEYIKADPDYGEIICRCEQITKKEVLSALNNPLKARSIVSIKYRSRVMMGRCQGGFCLPRIVALIESEFGSNAKDYFYNDKSGYLFTGRIR